MTASAVIVASVLLIQPISNSQCELWSSGKLNRNQTIPERASSSRSISALFSRYALARSGQTPSGQRQWASSARIRPTYGLPSLAKLVKGSSYLQSIFTLAPHLSQTATVFLMSGMWPPDMRKAPCGAVRAGARI